jgi:uncharacterized glyoxalase superfamily protein PhnB
MKLKKSDQQQLWAEAQRAPWGGYFGYFADPDGYLWKVVTGTYETRGVERTTRHPFSE